MNDAQSTVAGLKFQDCPGGGWNGMPPELERATVADCLAHGVCGCIYGDAVQHIERLRAALRQIIERYETAEEGWPMEDMVADARAALRVASGDPSPDRLGMQEDAMSDSAQEKAAAEIERLTDLYRGCDEQAQRFRAEIERLRGHTIYQLDVLARMIEDLTRHVENLDARLKALEGERGKR